MNPELAASHDWPRREGRRLAAPGARDAHPKAFRGGLGYERVSAGERGAARQEVRLEGRTFIMRRSSCIAITITDNILIFIAIRRKA
jgi:hypothetical protein